MALNADQHRLGAIEHQAIFDQVIKPRVFSAAQPVARPVAIIFGGQPGSGKSASVELAEQELALRGGCVQIIGDDFRKFHPGFGGLLRNDDKTAAFYTDRDTGQWVEKAIAHAKELRTNIVIEGTMRDSDKVAQTMQSLRAAGYEIDARALAVHGVLSLQGVLQRYENQKADRGIGRMTTPEAHQAAYDGMPVTLERIELEKLADRVTLYRRGGVAIYTNTLEEGAWTNEPQARAALVAERSRPLNQDELQSYVQGYDRLVELMARPGRGATDKELTVVHTLRAQAQALNSRVLGQQHPAEAPTIQMGL
jgi:predicted ABC-type ATPase